MKKTTFLLTSLIVLNSSLAWALPTVKIHDNPYQAGNGGEFKLVVTGNGIPELPTGTSMQTFCLERNEHIGFGRTYYVELNTKTLLGGVGGGPADPLDPRTAWLYNEFADGTLTGYDFDNTGVGRQNTAGSLQRAIWYLEEEITSVGSDTLAQQFLTQAQNSDWYAKGTIGRVRVLNLWRYSNGRGYAQDQIVRVVPAPGAVLLSGLGTVVVGAIRRRFLYNA